ncbi:MAG TPA: NUDIX hydrolase [Patescibacteria group bacterium]|nr:NUDIX hydrolase [Patescibacteria group bacterium]
MKKVIPKNAILVPDNAKLAFKGQIFDVYQWPQKLFDGTNATFELLKRPDTVQIIAIKNGKLILVNDEQPGRSARLHFPGGRADETDDSWETAARRELLEETGLSFKIWKLINVSQPIPKMEWFVPWYLATELEAEQKQNLDAGEKIEVKEVDFNTVLKMIIDGHEQTMSYAMPIFSKLKSIEELLGMTEFTGREVDK